MRKKALIVALFSLLALGGATLVATNSIMDCGANCCGSCEVK